MALSDLVESAILFRGTLFLHARPDLLSSGLGVDSRGRPIRLEAVDGPEPWPDGLPLRQPFVYPDGGIPLEEVAPDGGPVPPAAEAMVNGLPDWALEGGRTLQVRVDTGAGPRQIRIGPQLRVPAGDAPRRFEALLAVHRCAASLLLRFDPGTGAEAATVEVPFDTRHGGGPLAEGYHHVSVASPFGAAAVTVSMEIAYRGYRANGVSDAAYLFIANAGMQAGGAGVLEPRHAALGGSPGGGWFRARIAPALHRTDLPLGLALGRERVDLFAPEPVEVTLVADHGHSLVLRASAPLHAMLHVDGEPVERVEIGTGDSFVRLPARALRGEVVTVSIRDLSGSIVHLAVPVLAPRMLTPPEVLVRESRPPFPTDLTPRANHRYRALRAHLEAPVPGLDPAVLARAIAALDMTHETVPLLPIALPEVTAPRVSVVIPAHNKVAVTYQAICALIVAHVQVPFEVILVDDGSTDATARIEEIVGGLRVVRHAEPQRFIRACNAGVAVARGDHVVLLNNDTEPTAGWLDALLDAFGRFDRVGLAGAKLLFPDGRLQDAGGIVWGNGNPWNYGRGANPWEPRFCYARQADYLSGAAMMTTRAVWDAVGGLSDYLEPMYFEDTDFAFKVREAGYGTWFVPSAVVFHFEGMTSGTDTATGFKRYQEINRPKFKRRWARAFAGFGPAGQQPDLEKDRGIAGRVLFIDHGVPREDRDAGSHAARREMELVQSLGYKVTFLPQNLAHLGSYTEELERSGVEVIYAPFWLSVPEFLEKRAAEFDAVYITRYYVAQETIPHVRRLAPGARIILNNADLHFLRELRAALAADDPARMDAMRHVREQELEVMRQADLVLSYNEVEHAVIASHTEGKARVMTCPWVVDLPPEVPPVAGRRGLSFLGNFQHPPNADGLRWFCAEVLPRLEGPDARLSVYGARMDDAVRALASETVDPVGHVATLDLAFDPHRIFVAPLRSGAGIKGKVLGALAHGIPCVLSPIAAEGIGLRHGYDCLIAETPREWVAAIGRLSGDDALWTAMSAAGRAYVAERFSFAAGQERMRAAFEAVDLFGAT